MATLLQHVDCVVCNAGTILLDALANDRPVVCVLYDEGAPEGEQHAALNVTGKHYEEVIASNAFVRATDFEEVVAGIGRSLDRPDELADERRRVAREVMGEVDGRAADRVVDAIVETVRLVVGLAPEEAREAQEDEGGCDRKQEVEVGEEAERVQQHHGEGRERERDEGRPPTRAAHRDRDQRRAGSTSTAAGTSGRAG